MSQKKDLLKALTLASITRVLLRNFSHGVGKHVKANEEESTDMPLGVKIFIFVCICAVLFLAFVFVSSFL